MKQPNTVFVKGIRGTDPIVLDELPQIAFVGRSNVGKSSLISQLAGVKGLVRVSDKPGKTTEINYFLSRRSFYYVDLPGYGYARLSPKERQSIKDLIIWYVSASQAEPRLVVLVLDSKVGITEFDQQMIDILRAEGHPFVIAANKIDKLTQADRSRALSNITTAALGAEVIATSCLTPHGTDALASRIAKSVAQAVE
jgi:GTP-binding protein